MPNPGRDGNRSRRQVDIERQAGAGEAPRLHGHDLASLELLRGCQIADLDGIAIALQPKRFAPGDVLMREGEPGDAFALLIHGQVTITRASPAGVEHLADAAPGSILGELAVLRGRPRTATVTAVTPAVAAFGDRQVLLDLLDQPTVQPRLQHLASTHLARDLPARPITLAGGVDILLRPLLPADRQEFGAALEQLSSASRRRRFFSPVRPSPALIDYLVDIDYVDHFAWLVLDARAAHTGLASARYVRSDTKPSSAEVAFEVIDRLQGRGIGTLLVGAIAVAAIEAGITELVGNVVSDNVAMRAVFAKVHGRSSYAEPGVVRVVMAAGDAAGLLEPDLRRQLGAETRDIVTAASLAHMTPP